MVHEENNAMLLPDDLELLRLCARIERNCAKLYRYFGKLFGSDREIAALWCRTAIEEDNHAEQFNLAANLKGTNMIGIRVDSLKLMEVLKDTELLLKKVRKSPPTVKEALGMAVDLEDRLSSCHMNTLVVFSDKSLGKLFEAMGSYGNMHLKKLQGALTKISRNMDSPGGIQMI